MTASAEPFIFAKVHDLGEDTDPDTGTHLEACVEIEIDLVLGEEVHCLTTYVPPSYDRERITQAIETSVRAFAAANQFPVDTPFTITEYRHKVTG